MSNPSYPENRSGNKPGQDQIYPIEGGGRLMHIPAADPQATLLLAVPAPITSSSGLSHVLEHLLLTGSDHEKGDSLFFRTRAGSSAVDMNAVTNCRYLAVHFTCTDIDEYRRLLKIYVDALFTRRWRQQQFDTEVGSGDETSGFDGVVVNEMYGALADPGALLFHRCYGRLFDRGPKCFNPGGEPDLIRRLHPGELEQFHCARFRPENLIAVSYGQFDPARVAAMFDGVFDGAGVGRPAPRLKSVTAAEVEPAAGSAAIQQPRIEPTQLNTYPGADGSGGLAALAILLDREKNDTEEFLCCLLKTLIAYAAAPLQSKFEKIGLTLNQPPEIRSNEDDQVLFALLEGDRLNPERLVGQLERMLVELVKNLDSSTLQWLVEVAIYLFRVYGDRKFSAGVSASVDLLDRFLGGRTGVSKGFDCRHPSNLKSAFATEDLWFAVIQYLIRNNPCQVVLYTGCEPSPARRRGTPATAGHAMPAALRCIEFARTPATTAIGQSDVLCEAESHSNFRGSTLHHYPSPSDHTALVKVSLPFQGVSVDSIAELNVLKAIAALEASAVLPLTQIEVRLHAGRERGRFLACLELGHQGLADSAGSRIELLHQLLATVLDDACLKQQVRPAGERPQREHLRAILRAAEMLSPVAGLRNMMGHPGGKQRDAESAGILKPLSPHILVSGGGGQWLSALTSIAVDVEPPVLNSLPPEAFAAGYTAEPLRYEQIPGAVNYCASAWPLAEEYGANPQQDAALHLFASLATSEILEPELRGRKGVYASAADLRMDLGCLTMFSYRDPHLEDTRQIFEQAFSETRRGSFTEVQFNAARKRAISRLQVKGSFDMRAANAFDLWMAGYEQSYLQKLETAISTIDRKQFDGAVTSLLPQQRGSFAALIGGRNTAAAEVARSAKQAVTGLQSKGLPDIP